MEAELFPQLMICRCRWIFSQYWLKLILYSFLTETRFYTIQGKIQGICNQITKSLNEENSMSMRKNQIEIFHLNPTLNFGIPPVLVFQWEVYYKVDRLVTGLPAQQKGTTALWYSNKTSLIIQNIKFKTLKKKIYIFHD